MTKLEELQKAIEDVAEAGTGMLRKSQMAFDFSAPNPHHVAYTRTNASGTVSNVQAKGAPKPSGIFHPESPDYKHVPLGDPSKADPKPAPKPNASTKHENYPWGRLTKVEGKGIRAVLHPEHQEAVGKLQDGETARFLDEQGILWKVKRDGEHVKLTPPSFHSSKTLVVKHSDVAPSMNQAQMNGSAAGKHLTKLANHSTTDMARKIEAWHEAHTGNDITPDKIVGTEARHYTTMEVYGKRSPDPMDDFTPGFQKLQEANNHAPFVMQHQGKGEKYLIDPQGYNYARYVGHIKKDAAEDKPAKTEANPKQAAHDLKAELESDDFGMTKRVATAE